ncbi:MAG: septal ring factor EnvC (AmiA/AmiB activator) [Aureispira sp.]|jgi:septal ring factor EnvC (AmiA/AmiB activator)
MKRFIYIFLLLLGINSLYGQSRTALEKKRKSVNQQIHKTSQLLNKTANNKKATFKRLNALETQIGTREVLIQDVAQRVAVLDTMIDRKMTVVEELDDDLGALKENYKKLIRQLYRYKISKSLLAFFWSTKSFNRTYQRWIYVQHLEKYRSVQAIFIQKIQTDLGKRINQLEAQKTEKDQLLQEEVAQKQLLDKEKANKAYLITKLKKQEGKLRGDLKRKKRYKTQLSKKIEKAILQQIAAAKEAARKYKKKKGLAKTKSSKSPVLESIDYESVASEKFAQQKGKLMWPIYQGKIIGSYGKHQHPLFKDVQINNNGIDIQGQYNSVVRNIYEGQVVSVFTIPGYQNAIMVKHGAYYTTYSNVAKVYVKQGQRLKQGGQIGTIGRDSNAGGHLLHFEIWHNKYKENPALWLKR